MSECSGFSFLKMGLLVVVAIVRCDDRWARWGGTGGGRLGPLEARGARALGAPTSSIAVPTLFRVPLHTPAGILPSYGQRGLIVP